MGLQCREEGPVTEMNEGAMPNPDNIKVIMEHSFKEKTEALCLEKTDIGRK